VAPELLSQVEAGNLSAVARDVGFGVFLVRVRIYEKLGIINGILSTSFTF
jgi:hypothetical protein